jgi:hypothetical protein
VTDYQIDLLDDAGAVVREHRSAFEHDDAAIDWAGRLDHPYEIKVWQAGRLVAHFPALRRPKF